MYQETEISDAYWFLRQFRRRAQQEHKPKWQLTRIDGWIRESA